MQRVKKKRSGKGHAKAVLYGALLFVAITWGFSALLWGPIQAALGFTGAMVATGLTFTITYIAYAWLVKRTGAKPTL